LRRAPAGLKRGRLDVGGVQRTFWLAPAPEARAPLLVAIHGLGMTGRDMAMFTGLASRGPAAGFTTVFPDGWEKVWSDGLRGPRRDGVDDTRFVAALIDRLAADRLAREDAVCLAGISNGASFAEHLARHALVPVRMLALAAGTATEPSREGATAPRAPAAVLMFAGTADPAVPYGGGEIGPPGLLGHFADRQRIEPRRIGVAVETVASDWAAANGAPPDPLIEPIERPAGDLPVTLLRWEAPAGPPARLYRIEGGGHAWPGGPQYLPARVIGRVARLDASELLLDVAREQLDGAKPR
jgi:polyhydroxybutyrate depolymerase